MTIIAHLNRSKNVVGGCTLVFIIILDFFVLNLILSDLAILCRLRLQNLKQNITPPTPTGNLIPKLVIVVLGVHCEPLNRN